MGAAVGYLTCDGYHGTPVGLDASKAGKKAILRNERSRSITIFENSIFAKPCCCPYADDGTPIEVNNGGEPCIVYTVTLEKMPNMPFGMDVSVMPGVEYLPVSEIHTCSLVSTWNEKHPDSRVKIGDRIIEVNGVCNDPDQMMSACQIDNVLTIVLLRPEGYADEHQTPQKGTVTDLNGTPARPTPSTGLASSLEGVAGALDTVDSEHEGDAVALGAMISEATSARFGTPVAQETQRVQSKDSKGKEPEEAEEDFDDDDFMGAPVNGASPSTFPSKLSPRT